MKKFFIWYLDGYHKMSFLDVFSASITRPKAPVFDTANVSMTSKFFYCAINHLAYYFCNSSVLIWPIHVNLLLVDWRLTDLSFFFLRFVLKYILKFICPNIIRNLFNQLTFFLRLTLFTNMSNQISQIRVIAKTFASRANFFLQCSSLFLRACVSCLLNENSVVSQ